MGASVKGSEVAQRQGFVCKSSKEEAKVDSSKALCVAETKDFLKKLINLEEKQSHQKYGWPLLGPEN